MNKRTIMAMPAVVFWCVIGVCVLGIIIGSFWDYDIGMAVANRTDIGTYFAIFSPALAYCLIPGGGSCLYVGLKKKSNSYKPVAWTLLIFSWFIAVRFSNGYFGKHVRPLFGYIPGESSAFLSFASWALWATLYALVPLILIPCLDDTNPDKLIAVGAALIVASLASDAVMQWLKQVGSRPRPKYLLTLDDPASEYRDWWEMIPNLAGDNDNYQSWPSGHMSIVGVLYALPMLIDCLKKRSFRKKIITFIFICVFIVMCAYNRMHMTNHFLSDVCFGTLNAALITAVVCTTFESLSHNN